jgi:hypothetical protein
MKYQSIIIKGRRVPQVNGSKANNIQKDDRDFK